MSLWPLNSLLITAAMGDRLRNLLTQKNTQSPVTLAGLSAPARVYFLAGAAPQACGLLVARSSDEAKRWKADFESYGVDALYFPPVEISAVAHR
jgi:hypothetical protein